MYKCFLLEKFINAKSQQTQSNTVTPIMCVTTEDQERYLKHVEGYTGIKYKYTYTYDYIE